MKSLALVLTFAVAALLGGASAARADVNCNNTPLKPLVGIINDNVNVQNNASCTIGSAYEGAYINGNVQVRQGASLIIQARQYPSTITGNVQANQCNFALLEGAVTVGGNVQLGQCMKESGFDGPGIKISGNFQCQNNSGPCDATIGVVGGNVQIHDNSGAGANVSLNEIHGNLQCRNDSTKPSAAWRANWVSGNMQQDCAANRGFAWSGTLPTCTTLAAVLAKVPYIVSTPTTNDNTLYPAVTSTLMAATATHAAYCNVQFTYTAIGSPGSSAPLQNTAYGYGTNENQAINIGIGLPLSAADGGTGGVQGAWNGRLQHLGGGGLVGSVGSTTSATDASYVGSSTDTGHTGAQNGSAEGGGNFGVTGTYSPPNSFVPTTPNDTLDVGKIDDYIIEGIHEQVQWGKLISRIYYGEKWAYNYWNGCSTGGRQGLELAENYGDEFDGFITGAPAIWHDRFRQSDDWPWLVNEDDLVLAGYPTLSTALWNATTAVVVAACQANNPSGAVGYLDDPRACRASARLNICGKPGAAASPNCLTTQQAAAVDKIWAGPHNSSGNRIWYPANKGVTGGVVSFTTPGGFAGSTLQVMSWDHASTTIDLNLLYDSVQAVALYNATTGIAYETEALLGSTPDVTTGADGVAVNDLVDSIVPHFGVDEVNLDLVKNNGGKIMMWQGTADQLIRWYDSVDYYRLVATHYGGGTADFAVLWPWFRYYHAPGAFHCAAGVGPAPTDIFNQLVGWVENNAAPDPVPTSSGTFSTCSAAGVPDASCPSGQPTELQSTPTPFTPPLCPWPTSAVYNGSGPGNVASSFHCAGNLDANNYSLCQMLRTPTGEETSNALDYAEAGISPRQCPVPQ